MGHTRIISALNCWYAFMCPRKCARVIRSSAGDVVRFTVYVSSERDIAAVVYWSEKQTWSQSWREREKSCVVKCYVVCGVRRRISGGGGQRYSEGARSSWRSPRWRRRERKRKKESGNTAVVGNRQSVRSCPRKRWRSEQQRQGGDDGGRANKLPGRSQRQVKQRRRG